MTRPPVHTKTTFGHLSIDIASLLASLHILEGSAHLSARPHATAKPYSFTPTASAALLVLSFPTQHARLDDITLTYRLDLKTVVAQPHPATALLDIIARDHVGDCQDAPLFCFIRKIQASNTPRWLFVSWIPEKILSSSAAYYVAELRSSFLQYISTRTVTSVVCCTKDDLLSLRPFLVSGANGLSNNVLDSTARLDEHQEQEALLYLSPSIEHPAPSFVSGLASLTALRLRLSAGIPSLLTPLLVPQTALLRQKSSKDSPNSVSDHDLACSTDSKIKNTIANGYALILRIDDTNSLVIGERVIKCATPGQLAEAFEGNEPRYYLAAFFNTTALLLYIPEQRHPTLWFLYPLSKPTVHALLQRDFNMIIHRTADVRHGDSLFSTFHGDPLGDAETGEQLLRVSDTSTRSHPLTEEMLGDPFLQYQMAVTDTGVRYVPVRAAQRFSF